MISFEPLHSGWEELPKPATYSYKIGPFTIQIESADAALAHTLTRAFSHLEAPSAIPDLTIRIWSGPKLPSLDWKLIQTNGYRGYSNPPFYIHYFESLGALSAIDTERNIAYYAVQDPESLPWWVSGSPLQAILHVWFRKQGIQLTHSASIGNETKTVLLAGKGGSGKSTTVLALLEEGFSTLGEDYLLLSPNRAYSVYQSAKWQPQTRVLFPSYESQIANPDFANQEKALVFYQDIFPTQLLPSAQIGAVVSLEIKEKAELKRSDLRTSLQSLLLTTVMQLPHPDPSTTQLLRESLQGIDHYHLSLGPNLKENVSLVKSLFQ